MIAVFLLTALGTLYSYLSTESADDVSDGGDPKLRTAPQQSISATESGKTNRRVETVESDQKRDRYDDGATRVHRNGAVTVTETASNCGFRPAGLDGEAHWQCDWTVAVDNPYEALDDEEIQALSSYDPYAALVLSERLLSRASSLDEAMPEASRYLVQAVVLLSPDERTRGAAHMLDSLGMYPGAISGADAGKIHQVYPWVRAMSELNLLPASYLEDLDARTKLLGLKTDSLETEAASIRRQFEQASLVHTGSRLNATEDRQDDQ